MEQNRLRIRGYQLGGTLGRGAHGLVYSGLQDATGRSVAVKILARGDRRHRARFAREAKILGKLAGHPHVVEVIGFGNLRRGGLWLAMERLPGTLAEEVNGTARVRPDRVADVGVQLASALAATHRLDLLHRDVKPHNVLVGNDGRIKLADFGIALAGAAPTESRRSDSAVGALDYVAPEIRSDTSQATKQSDQYGLCATMAALLLGRAPQIATADTDAGSEPDRTERADLEAAGAPAKLVDLLIRGLQVDPRDRFPSIDDLARELGGIQEANGWTTTRYHEYDAPPAPRQDDAQDVPADAPTTRALAKPDRRPTPAGRTPSSWRIARRTSDPSMLSRGLPWESEERRSRRVPIAVLTALLVVLGVAVYRSTRSTSDQSAGDLASPAAAGRLQVSAVNPPVFGDVRDVSGLTGDTCMFRAPVFVPIELTLVASIRVGSLRIAFTGDVTDGDTIEVTLGEEKPTRTSLVSSGAYDYQEVAVGPVVTDKISIRSEELGLCHLTIN